MLNFFLNLFDTSDFPNRWNCGTWTAGHGWLHILSDVATWGAYTTIPFVLTYFAWRRKDIPFTRLFWLFAIFILACGSVHIVEAIIFWVPIYRVSALLKFITAVASWLTVVALIQITPQALKLPGLAATNSRLQEEINRRSRTELALRKSEQRARLLLESTGEAIYGLDLNGHCTFCNPACVRLLGYDSANDLIGRDMHELIHHTRPDGTAYPAQECRIYTALRKDEEVHIDDEVLWRADGSSFPAEYRSHPIRSDGETVGAVVTFTDITERKHAGEQLVRARYEAEAANNAKSQFLANTSHEIRTPLTAIIGYSDILLKQLNDPAKRAHVETIQRNGRSLLDLIDDILDLSRIEAGRFESKLADCRLDTLLGNVTRLMQLRADEKSLTLDVIVEGKVPEVIQTDEKRLQQILINLVANAIKFTERGSVTIRVLTEKKSGTQRICFRVCDTGIGINDDQRSRLFRPFEQGDASVNRKFGGSGLGLAISKRLVEALDGELTVESRVGIGSEFCVSVPMGLESTSLVGDLKLKRDAVPKPTSEIATRIQLNCRVLLADDRRDVRHVAKHFLSSAGASVVTAEDGEQAIEAIRDAANRDVPFDVVVMDMQMPNVDGYSAVARLRAEGQQLPIIALTADAMTGDREKTLSIGCDEYLSKPIDSEKLLAVVARVVSLPQEELVAHRHHNARLPPSEL